MRNAVITGAGSGVGRAVAIELSKAGWNVALVGRREEPLRETAALCTGVETLVHSCDIGDHNEVDRMGEQVLAKFTAVQALVNAAGTNVPHRSLEALSLEDFHQMLNTNLNGAYYCLQAFLPGMRQRQTGTIINIISDAAKQASPKAGPGYTISKFGMLGLTQAINAEERGNGVRACAILPGDIDTPLLNKRPSPPPADARTRMLRPEDIARCVMLAIDLPPHAIIEELLIRPR